MGRFAKNMSDVADFDVWMGAKLCQLNNETDIGVFVEYIRGILEDESADDLNESLSDILSGITPTDLENSDEVIANVCDEIISYWKKYDKHTEKCTTENSESPVMQISQLMEKQQKDSVITVRELSEDEKARKLQYFLSMLKFVVRKNLVKKII